MYLPRTTNVIKTPSAAFDSGCCLLLGLSDSAAPTFWASWTVSGSRVAPGGTVAVLELEETVAVWD